MPASTQEKSNFKKFTDKFTEVSVKIGHEVHCEMHSPLLCQCISWLVLPL